MAKRVTETEIDVLVKRPYARVLTPDDSGGYVAEVLELPGCISEGDTPDQAIENLEDAMRGWLAVSLERGDHIPAPLESGEHNGRILLRVPRWVHKQCVRLAEIDEVSLNQWILEAIGERIGAEGFARRLLEATWSRLDAGVTRVAEGKGEHGEVPIIFTTSQGGVAGVAEGKGEYRKRR